MEDNYFLDKSVLVTGGAGFIGSHLVDRLLQAGAFVTVVDNFITGTRNNLAKALTSTHFRLIEADAALPPETYLQWNQNKLESAELIFHLASPASPKGYGNHPVETYQINAFGTHFLAEYALKHKAILVYSSTSESYGDPLEHPQKETYWGNVNPIGQRACYDVSKRFGEMVLTTWHRTKALDARIVRIFNTYGPRLDPGDGRVIPNFITQALKGEPITVYGEGKQTRSFCYIDDLVEYLVRVAQTKAASGEVVNIGNNQEYTMLQMAEMINEITRSTSELVFQPLPQDDPQRRRPDLSKAMQLLEFEPQISLDNGLTKTIEYFASTLTNKD